MSDDDDGAIHLRPLGGRHATSGAPYTREFHVIEDIQRVLRLTRDDIRRYGAAPYVQGASLYEETLVYVIRQAFLVEDESWLNELVGMLVGRSAPFFYKRVRIGDDERQDEQFSIVMATAYRRIVARTQGGAEGAHRIASGLREGADFSEPFWEVRYYGALQPLVGSAYKRILQTIKDEDEGAIPFSALLPVGVDIYDVRGEVLSAAIGSPERTALARESLREAIIFYGELPDRDRRIHYRSVILAQTEHQIAHDMGLSERSIRRILKKTIHYLQMRREENNEHSL